MGLLANTWIGCFLALLPGPPRIKFDNANFQLFPVDKTNKYCPEIQAGRDIGFYLYSRKFPEEPRELRIGDDVILSSSGLDLRLPTVIYFPPFFDGFDSRNSREVREAYLKRGDCNFLLVVADRLNAGPWYLTAVTNTQIVGRYSAAFIDYLLLKGLPLESLHFVGLSIGAHAAGVAGRNMRFGRPPRITGLDPAFPLFSKKRLDMRLDKSDADFVDVIHTDPFIGMSSPIGHADFYVDADEHPQPGCKIRDILKQSNGPLFTVFCSHLRSNKLYATSVLYPHLFPSFKCSSMKELRSGHCKSHRIEFMGPSASSTSRGIFYVPAKSRPELINEIT